MTTTCENCGASVTDRFARVFGDNDDQVHACLECTTGSAVKNDAAAKPDFERRAPASGTSR